jgi:hypothetical protein
MTSGLMNRNVRKVAVFAALLLVMAYGRRYGE